MVGKISAPTGHSGVSRQPWWVNYGVAILIQAALTAFLLWLYPHFPLGKFPAPYAAALLFTVLVFGEGPAALGLALSLILFHYFFVPPMNSWALPSNTAQWASVVAYVLVNGTVVLAVSVIQRGRRRAERLAESLQEHAEILDMAHVFVRDTNDRIIVWNTGLEALYGFTKEEAVGRVSHELFQTVFPESKEAVYKSMRNAGHWEGELVHTAKDGSKVIVASHQVLHRDAEGKPAAILEVNNDITGRLQAQRALENALQDLAIADQDKDMMNEELRVSNDELLREVLQRTHAEEEASKLAAIVESSDDAIIGKTLDGIITSWNAGAEVVYGYKSDEIIGHSISVLVPSDRDDDTHDILQRIVRGEPIEHMETERVRKDGRRIYVALTVSPVKDASGNIVGASTIARDISDSQRAEQEREMTVEFLQIINQSEATADLIRSATTFFQRESDCEAVGIRLKEDGDYPYYEARGFSKDFIAAENSLCTRDRNGCVACDPHGYPICDCMCGNIIQGRTDPSKPFFSEHGSFWTNCTTELLATSSEADRQTRTRNRCNGEGYESVALIPIHLGDERLGLLQLNDRRKGMFSANAIGLWERFADYLAVALTKFQAEESLKASEERYHTLFDTLIEGFCTVEVIFDDQNKPVDYRFLEINQAFEERTGLHDVQGRRMRELAPNHEEYWFEIYGRVASTGEPVRFQNEAKALGRYYDVCAYRIGGPESRKVAILFNDITERHRAEEAVREAEAQKSEFYRQTILAATGGKLVISERDEIGEIGDRPLLEWQIDDIQDVGRVRVEATSAAREFGLDESRVYDFMACVVESTGNAAKHAKRGHASLYQQDSTVLFVVTDGGPGISAMRLPDVALTKGYTTAGTLGMGYKVMISFADKVYLATGPEGTTVALEMKLRAKKTEKTSSSFVRV